jgi:hypothetical protein
MAKNTRVDDWEGDVSGLDRFRRLQMSIGVYLFVLFILTVGATRANAVAFNFNFSGPGISANGTFDATSAFPNFPSCPFLTCDATVDGISGTFNGFSMTLLPSGTVCQDGRTPCNPSNPPFNPPFANDNAGLVNNNSLSPDGDGIGFSANGVDYNLNIDIQVCGPSGCTTLTSYSAVAGTTTPIPTALPLFATGIGALGLLGWRRKRKTLCS